MPRSLQSRGRRIYLSSVNNALKYLSRWLFVSAVTFSLGFIAVHFGRQTPWYKDHLYQQLLVGDADARLTAATKLALVGAEKQLLEGLQAENPDVHSVAQRGLDHLWFTAAGRRAYQMIDEACAASDREDFPAALRLLDEITRQYPDFAEGWHRRAGGPQLQELGRAAVSAFAVALAFLLALARHLPAIQDTYRGPAARVDEIDRLNILQATLLAMRRAVEGLRLKPGRVLVDGNRIPVLKVPAEARSLKRKVTDPSGSVRRYSPRNSGLKRMPTASPS